MTIATQQVTRAEFEARLKAFLEALRVWQDKYFTKHFSSLQTPTYSVERGVKYLRIVQTSHGQRSVYCFLDFQGNIYKSESWKKPAKHIRGSIFADGFGFGTALTNYGAAYLR